MNTVTLEEDQGIFIMHIPIALTLDSILSIDACLDIVEAHNGPTALVITSKHPKIFCAGMNLKFITDYGLNAAISIAKRLMVASSRIMALGVPTVAAINGHAVAGGLLLALCCDYRVMTTENAMLRMSEVALGMVIPKGGSAILKAKVGASVHRDLVLRDKRFYADEALSNHIVDCIARGEEVLGKAICIAKENMQFGEKKKVYQELKNSSYYESITSTGLAEYNQEFIEAMRFQKSPNL